MDQIQFNHLQLHAKKLTLIDIIRQDYLDVIHFSEHQSNESKVNEINDIKSKIDNFIQNVFFIINKKLQNNTLYEISNDIASIFSKFPKISLQYLCNFIEKFNSNSNYIIISSSIFSELIITHQKIDDIKLVDEALNETILQIQNNTKEIRLFGHIIPPQFKDSLIINLMISSKITNKISPFFLNNILPNYLFSNEIKFNFLLQKMMDSSFINVSITKPLTEIELSNLIFNRSIKISSFLNNETLSFIAYAIYFIKNNGKIRLNGFDSNLIFPFLAIMAIYLQDYKEKLHFSNKLFSNMILRNIESYENESSYLIKDSIIVIFSMLDLIKQNQIISNEQYIKMISIMAVKSFQKRICFDISLIFPYLFNNSFYFYSFLNDHYICFFDFLVENCSKIQYFNSEKLELRIFRQEKIIYYLKNLYISKNAIKTLHFFNNYCKLPSIKNIKNAYESLIQIVNHKITNQCWDDVIIIGKFLQKNDCPIYELFIKNSNLPNYVINILLDKQLYVMKNKEILSCLLNDNIIKKNDIYFEKLFNYMIKDQEIRLCYLEHLIYINTEDQIHIHLLLPKFINEYEKYHDDFIKVIKEQFYYFQKEKTLFMKEDYKLKCTTKSNVGDQIIDEIFNKINESHDNYQAFVCLFNIGKTFPFLFYQNPHQAFKSVLRIFDTIHLIFDEDKNDFTETTISAMSFLFTILQYPFIIDNFMQWFLLDIMRFTNSQIFCFIYLLTFLFKGNKSKIILGYIIKFKFLDNIEKILEREHKESNFKNQFSIVINDFIIDILRTMMKLTKYEIIQIEELMKINHPFTFMNEFSIQTNNLQFLKIFQKKKLNDKFLNLFIKEKKYWLYNSLGNEKLPTDSRINSFIEQISQNSREFIKYKEFPTFNDFYTIRMIRYLVMQPKYKYNWFLYGHINYMNEMQKLEMNHTLKLMILMNKKTKVDPTNIENTDCELLNIIDYLKPQLLIIFKLILFNSSSQSNIKLCKNLFNEIDKKSEFSLFFIDSLFQFFKELSKSYDDINLHSMHNLINLFEYLLTIFKYKKETQLFLKQNLINLALSPKWRSDITLLQKTLKLMIDYNSEFPFQITLLIKFILMENEDNLDANIDIYNKLNKNQKNNLNGIIFNIFDKKVNKNEKKTIISYFNKVPVLYVHRIESLIIFLKTNPNYFKNTENLNKDTNKFLLDSFDSLSRHYTINNNDKKGLSNDFYKIYDMYNKIIDEIIENHPNKFRKYKFLIDNPELISLNARINVFNDMMDEKKKDESIEFDIDRNNIFESSFTEFNINEPEDFLKEINIKYNGEKGIDLGGVLRDWFTNLSHEIFNPNFALFSCSKNEKSYQPNKKSFVNENHLNLFKFAGIIVARALMEGICINVNFTTSFWKQILHYEPNFDDLKEVDYELYKSIQSLKNSDVDSLYLTFTYNEDEFGYCLSIPLKENGEQINVTNENKDEYIQLLSNYILKSSIENQVNAFCEGFHALISFEEIRIFTPNELNTMIGGIIQIDVNDFKKHTEFEEPYTAETPVVKLFFEVISKWDNEKLSKLLKFMIGISRLPVNGFEGYCDQNGLMSIAPGGEKHLLPVAHTCINRLDLPKYETHEELNEKLSIAIENCNSFEII